MLIGRLDRACREFGQMISQKETRVMGHGIHKLSCIKFAVYKLEAEGDFVHLVSTISNPLCHNNAVNRRLGKAATTISWLNKHAGASNKLP